MKRFAVITAAILFAVSACGTNTEKWLSSYEKVADAYLASIQAGAPDEKLSETFGKMSTEGAEMVSDLQQKDPEQAAEFQSRYEQIALEVLMTEYRSEYSQYNQ